MKTKTTTGTKSTRTTGAPKLIAKLPGMSYSAHSLAFSPDGTMLASGGHGSGDRLWRTSDGKQLHALGADDHVVTGLAFSPDSRRLAVASTGDAVDVWDTTSGQRVNAIKVKGTSRDIAFSRDGKRFAVAVGKSVLVWDAATAAQVAKLDHKAITEGVLFLPDGRLLVRAGKTVVLYDVATATAKVTIDHGAGMMAVDVSSDGRMILTAGSKHHARVWDAATGKAGPVFDDHDDHMLYHASFVADGKRLLTVDEENDVRLWDVTTGALVANWSGDDEGVTAGSWPSPDGTLIAAQFDALQLIDLAAHSVIAKLPFVADEQCLTFSPDGSLLAAGSDEAIMLWRLR